MSGGDPPPDADIPADLAARLAEAETATLRRTVDYIRGLLRERTETTRPEIEAGTDEEIVRVDERDGYTEVVKRHACAEGCADCPHEPYLYHARAEERPNGERHLNWTLIGRVRE